MFVKLLIESYSSGGVTYRGVYRGIEVPFTGRTLVHRKLRPLAFVLKKDFVRWSSQEEHGRLYGCSILFQDKNWSRSL